LNVLGSLVVIQNFFTENFYWSQRTKTEPAGGPRNLLCKGCAINSAAREHSRMKKWIVFNREGLGWETGIEPATFGATDRRSTS
jgi:hypothetical protein